jgi:uncharacterized membrane protein YkvA (DUF1232 family)
MSVDKSEESPQRSWWQAYRLYREDDGKGLALFLKIGLFFLGVNVVDEPIPVLGQIDDPFFVAQLVFTLIMALLTKHYVKRYR